MEFAEGGDLRHYLEKNFHSMKLEQKLKMGYEITNGLKFLHNKQIIHRDLVSL
jgi:serine/threonine protein kinase